jgi:hypothetical protein
MIRSNKLRWTGHVVWMGKRINVYSILVRKSKEKRSFGRYKSWWDDNIKWGLEKWNGVVRTGFIWLRIWTSRVIL